MTISDIALLNDRLLNGAYLRTIAHATPGASAIHGQGLFADRNIEAGQVLCVLDGQVVNALQYPHVLGALEWNAISKDLLLVRALRTSYGFINHARQPNCAIREHARHVITLAPIAAGGELTLNYLDQPLPDAYLLRSDVSYLHA